MSNETIYGPFLNGSILIDAIKNFKDVRKQGANHRDGCFNEYIYIPCDDDYYNATEILIEIEGAGSNNELPVFSITNLRRAVMTGKVVNTDNQAKHSFHSHLDTQDTFCTKIFNSAVRVLDIDENDLKKEIAAVCERSKLPVPKPWEIN